METEDIECEKEIKEDYKNEEIKKNICYGNMTNDQVEEIYSYIKQNLINNTNKSLLIYFK